MYLEKGMQVFPKTKWNQHEHKEYIYKNSTQARSFLNIYRERL